MCEAVYIRVAGTGCLSFIRMIEIDAAGMTFAWIMDAQARRKAEDWWGELNLSVAKVAGL